MPQAYYRCNGVLTVLCAVFLVAFSAHSGDSGRGPFGQGEWPSYGADTANSKYAPLDQIHKDNVKDLHIAWRWRSVDNAILKDHPELWTMVNEATPLMLDGRLYTSTSLSQVAAIDARTGETLWVYDPESYKQGSPPNLGFVHRGVAYWADGETQRIFIGTGDAQLIALDATTGQPVPEFGTHGRIDLTQGLHRPVDPALYGVTSPPVICRNVIVVGSSIIDYPRVYPTFRTTHGQLSNFEVSIQSPLQRRRLCAHRPALLSRPRRNRTGRRS